MQKIRRLTSVRQIVDVIDEARGRGYCRRLIERSKQRLSNCKADNRLPYDSFLVVTAELEKLSCTASPALWGIKAPAKSRAA